MSFLKRDKHISYGTAGEEIRIIKADGGNVVKSVLIIANQKLK